jgi:hypothetical protein
MSRGWAFALHHDLNARRRWSLAHDHYFNYRSGPRFDHDRRRLRACLHHNCSRMRTTVNLFDDAAVECHEDEPQHDKAGWSG